MISSSPERNTFQANNYIKRCEDKGEEPKEEYLDIYKSAKQRDAENMVNPEWIKDNMEYDLRTTEWILNKVRSSNAYAQNLYASMCNNEFIKNDVWPLLQGKRWGCSWRYAGGIVADMRQEGDYIDWYCSGIRNHDDMDDESFMALTKEAQELYIELKKYVPECQVTDEIREDLLKLGWIVIPDK